MIKAILIDDEVHCIDTLSMLLADYCPEVEVMKKCYSAREGLEAIETLQPELVFLDIEMPLMNGFEILEQFKEIPFSIVFTTSYDQYAIKAIRFSALDYLLKPIDAKELIAAVHKIHRQKPTPSTDQVNQLLEQIRMRENDYNKIADLLNRNKSFAAQPLSQSQQRRLAAILFTDIVGYTAMMQKDERKAAAMIRRHSEVLKNAVKEHGGEVLNDYGDGSLCIFSSSAEAAQCALDVQIRLQREPVVPLRIGLHIGEVFFEEGKIMGDGVNLASRIQSLGQAHTVLLSEEFQDKIKNIPSLQSVLIGSFEFRHVEKPIRVYALSNEAVAMPDLNKLEGKLQEKVHPSTWKKWLSALGIR